MGSLFLGTCSWNHRDWLGVFYPQDAHPKDFLSFYSKSFKTVECDATWDDIPKTEQLHRWYSQTCEGFIFALKFPKVITHVHRLKEADKSTNKFLSAVSNLKEKLGPLLIQLPPSFTLELDTLRNFLKIVPNEFKYAVEFRQPSWYCESTYELLREKDIALVSIEMSGIPRTAIKTTDYVYIRWIGDRKKILNLTRRWNKIIIDRTKELEWWKGKIRGFLSDGCDVFGYFNNHYSGYAAGTMQQFISKR